MESPTSYRFVSKQSVDRKARIKIAWPLNTLRRAVEFLLFGTHLENPDENKGSLESAFTKSRLLIGVFLCFASLTLAFFALQSASAQGNPQTPTIQSAVSRCGTRG